MRSGSGNHPLVLLVGEFLRLGRRRFDIVDLLLERCEGRVLFGGERHGLTANLAQAVGVAVGEVRRDLDPLPAFRPDGDRLLVEFLGNHHLKQADVLKPPAVVALKQVVEDGPASLLIGRDADELRPLVRCAHRAFGQHAPDGIRLLVVGLAQPLEHLLLALVIAVDGERHQLVERHAVLGVDVEQLGRDGSKAEALLDDGNRDELVCRDLLLGLALGAQCEECPELIERMERSPLDIFGEAVLLGETIGPNDAGYRRVLRETPLLHQQRERPIAPPAGRDLRAGRPGASLSTLNPSRRQPQPSSSLRPPHARRVQHDTVAAASALRALPRTGRPRRGSGRGKAFPCTFRSA